MDWEVVRSAIARALGEEIPPGRGFPVGGGSINSAYRFDAGDRAWFVKLNRAERLGMFEAEAAGLALLAAHPGPRVPRFVTLGEAAPYAFIVLEYVPLRAATAPVLAGLGEELALLHRTTAPRFGWERDNTLGTTPQPNAWDDDWVSFWRRRRLGFQLELATANGHPALAEAAAPLLEGLAGFFSGYRPLPSLLHGDLWAGNAASDLSGAPVIFDPACYFGDREAELAMTELFGGFTASFYDAYNAHYPLDPGYGVRRDLYQLYHVLNHLNLFGGGYLAQAQRLIQRLRAEL